MANEFSLFAEIHASLDESSLIKQHKKINAATTKDLQKGMMHMLAESGKALFSAKQMDKQASRLRKIDDERMKAIMAGNQEQVDGLSELFRKEMAQVNKISKRRLDARREAESLMDKGVAQRAEVFADGVQNAFMSLKSGDIAKVLKNLGKGLEVKGMGMKAKGAEDASGGMGGMVSMLGSLLVSIGPAIAAIGALVGAFVALGAIVVAADSHFKQFNSQVQASGMSVGSLVDNLDDAENAYNVLARASSQVGYDLKLTQDEVAKVASGFERAGFELKEYADLSKDAATAAQGMEKPVQAAVKWSRLLGMGLDEASQMMGEQMENLGTDIEGVDARFAAVYSSAQQSGFGVKRFFNMVLQATSGMAMFNVRMEEAAGMLIHLGTILGSTLGGQFLQSVNKAMQDESYKDSYKRVLMTGPAVTKKVMETSAMGSANDFINKFSLKSGEAGAKISAALEKAGIVIPTETGKMGGAQRDKMAQDLVKKLSKLDANNQKMVIARINKTDAGLAQSLTNLIAVSKGTSGKTGDMAKAVDELSTGGKVVMELNSTRAVMGKSLHELTSITDLMAAQEMTGMNRQQLEQMQRVGNAMEGNLLVLREDKSELAKIRSNGEDTATQDKKILDFQKQQVKEYGAFTRENGDIVAGRIDELGNIVESGGPIKDLDTYIMSQGERMAGLIEAPLTKQEAAATAVERNTTEMTKLLKMGVDFFLSGIYSLLQELLAFITGEELTTEQRTTKRGALYTMEEQQREVLKAGEAITGKLDAKRSELDKTGDLEKRKILAGEIAELEKRKADIEASGKKIEENKKKVQAISKQSAEDSDFVAGVAGIAPTKRATPEEQIAKLSEETAAQTKEANANADEGKYRELKLQKESQDWGMGKFAPELAKELAAKIDDSQLVDALGRAGFEMEDAKEIAKYVKETGGLPEEVKAQLSAGGGSRAMDALLGETGGAGPLFNALLPGFGGSTAPTGPAPIVTPATPGGKFEKVVTKARHGGMDDFLLRLDNAGNITPITAFNPSDGLSILGAKPNGPVAGAAGAGGGGGGGGAVIHNHFYNDSKANYTQAKKLYRSLSRGG